MNFNGNDLINQSTYGLQGFGQYGWICPKCGRVMSPHTSFCLFCNGTTQTVTATETSTDADNADIKIMELSKSISATRAGTTAVLS